MTHTTPVGKAKCLAYRDGKRCGRVAKVVVKYHDHQGDHRQPVCQECAKRIGGTIVKQSPKGFTVHNAGGFSGMIGREYKEIQ